MTDLQASVDQHVRRLVQEAAFYFECSILCHHCDHTALPDAVSGQHGKRLAVQYWLLLTDNWEPRIDR